MLYYRKQCRLWYMYLVALLLIFRKAASVSKMCKEYTLELVTTKALLLLGISKQVYLCFIPTPPQPPFPPFPFPSENNPINSHSLIQIILTSTPGNCSTATSAWLLSQLQGLGNRTALKLTNHSFLGTSLRTNIGSFFTLQSSFPFDCG